MGIVCVRHSISFRRDDAQGIERRVYHCKNSPSSFSSEKVVSVDAEQKSQQIRHSFFQVGYQLPSGSSSFFFFFFFHQPRSLFPLKRQASILNSTIREQENIVEQLFLAALLITRRGGVLLRYLEQNEKYFQSNMFLKETFIALVCRVM